MKEVNIYVHTEYAGTFSKGKGVYHVILETMVNTPKGEEAATLKDVQACEDVTRNKLVLIAIEAALKRMKKPAKIKIYVSSDYIESSFNNWLEQWHEKNFEGIKYPEQWLQIYVMSNVHDIEIINTEDTPYSKVQAQEVKIYKEKANDTKRV